jgi:cell division protein FtsI (penicillin-binding protein 3)
MSLDTARMSACGTSETGFGMGSLTTRRVYLLAKLAFAWAAVIVARLVYIQIVHHADYQKLAQQQQQQTVELQAPRGMILDRCGQRLAMSLRAESVVVDPLRIPDLGIASDIFSKILNLDAGELLARMKFAVESKNGFMWVKRKITREEAQRLRDLKLEWIEFRMESGRYYPNKSLAAHVLGGVDFEGKGNGGVEQFFNSQLKGNSGELHLSRDVQKRGFASTVAREPQPGQDLKLTIDSRVQFVAEREVKKLVEQHHAKSGSIVALDPKTGDIIALANYPTFDPNDVPTKKGMQARENLAVTAPFEPGSVYKVITLTAALETTRIRPETIINCGNGIFKMPGRVIHDHNSYSALSMEDVLARSSNIGAINIGLQVGPASMFDYMRRFGFGAKTGIPLPGESSGIVRPLKRWQKTSLSSVAMGHEVGVTALQLAQACAVIASGGFFVKPRLIMDQPIAQSVRVLKPETAITMRRMMEGVVIKPYGTAHKYARIPGYTSAGKTGTAQIYDFRSRQYTHYYNASFMGFAPVTNPAIVVVVTVNGTQGVAGYGGPTSAPAFREVAAEALRMMDVPKDLPETLSPEEGEQADENDVAIAGLSSSPPSPLVQADDALVSENLPATADQRNFLAPEKSDSGLDLSGPRVPNFQGKSLRDVIQESAALGLPLEFAGAGVARVQFPEPGRILPMGQSIRVQFGR